MAARKTRGQEKGRAVSHRPALSSPMCHSLSLVAALGSRSAGSPARDDGPVHGYQLLDRVELVARVILVSIENTTRCHVDIQCHGPARRVGKGKQRRADGDLRKGESIAATGRGRMFDPLGCATIAPSQIPWMAGDPWGAIVRWPDRRLVLNLADIRECRLTRWGGRRNRRRWRCRTGRGRRHRSNRRRHRSNRR